MEVEGCRRRKEVVEVFFARMAEGDVGSEKE